MRRDAGFTLAEVLAALAIFSIAALALLHLSTENARAAGVAREHAFASVVAENLIVEAMVRPEGLAIGAESGEAALAGRDWDWTRTVLATEDPGLVRIDVQVRVAGEENLSAQLSAFRGGVR